MQLISPGVQVSIIDESIYAGSGPGTVPLFIVATAENKLTQDGSTFAEATTKENSEKLYLVSSQRELTQLFGEPKFASVGGASINGSPLNEYGILAAHSFLGISNRAYIIRADLDLNQLQPTVIEPQSCATVGTYWLNTDSAEFGLHSLVVDRFDPASVEWQKEAINYVFTGTPDDAVGADGEFAVEVSGTSTIAYFKKEAGAWALISDLVDGASDPVRVIASSVYPSFDYLGAALVTGDIGYAYWINTSGTATGVDLMLSQMDASCVFNTLDVPVFVGQNNSAATAYFNGTPVNGNLYVGAFANGSEFTLHMYRFNGTTWVDFDSYVAQGTQPTNGPTEGTYWFNPDVGFDAQGNSTVDLLINNGLGAWVNVDMGYTYNGDTSSETVYMQSLNPLNMIPVPTLTTGDLWIDPSDSNYPAIYRWKSSKWVKIDPTNQTTPSGILFRDARPHPEYVINVAAAGVNNGGGTGPDLDIDVPDPDAYPMGMLLWNTRFSANNVKVFREEYLVREDSNGDPVFEPRWETASGNRPDGSLLAGMEAQRKVVTTKLQGVLAGNDEIRAESIFFNLIATPGFTECIDEMINLNIDRKQTAFVVGDTPFTLAPKSTELQSWAKNLGNASENGLYGLISADPYVGVYYPSCAIATNLDGTNVVVPASHIAMRTMAYNDQVAYQWFAPAGLQRGRVSNAASVGYVDAEGEYVPVALNQGQRDVLYEANINPIVQFPGQGIIVYGQKTRNPFASAMDRINVARLTNYLRYQLDIIVRPFLFEPNDQITRDNVKEVVERFVSEIVTLRGITDFLVVCDESNNTPARIDRNELWIDVFIVPTKAVEFIYIPVRIRNTGGI